MLRPKFYITITNSAGIRTEFTAITYFEIDESYEQITNTARIILPRKVTQSGREVFTSANPIFKRKDKITIEAGYFPNRQLLFEGFISHVSANIPVELECENYMFLFKQYSLTFPKEITPPRKVSLSGKPLKYSWTSKENIKLSELIGNVFHEGQYQGLIDGIDLRVIPTNDISLGQFRASNATPAQIFQKLKDVYGIYCYMVGKTLVVGLASDATDTKTKSFKMEEVCINSNELQYVRAEDVQIKVTMTSMLSDNNKLEATSGSPEGENRSYFVYGITSQTDLQKMADERAARLKYTGFRGQFKTFGEPYVRAGDYAKITSTVLPERDGNYLISGVKRIGGVKEGYRQILELEEKI